MMQHMSLRKMETMRTQTYRMETFAGTSLLTQSPHTSKSAPPPPNLKKTRFVFIVIFTSQCSKAAFQRQTEESSVYLLSFYFNF